MSPHRIQKCLIFQSINQSVKANNTDSVNEFVWEQEPSQAELDFGLFNCAIFGSVPCFREFKVAGGNPRSEEWGSLLSHALRHKASAEFIEELITYGCSVDSRRDCPRQIRRDTAKKHWDLPLHIAINNNLIRSASSSEGWGVP